MYSPDQFFYMQAVERRAASVIWKRYQVNKYELNLLASLSAYLCLKGKKIISRKIFTDWLGLGIKEERRCWMFINHMIRKGVIHRLAYRRSDGNSLAISNYGIRILQDFYQALPQDDQHGGTFSNLGIDITTLPDGYILKQAGRS